LNHGSPQQKITRDGKSRNPRKPVQKKTNHTTQIEHEEEQDEEQQDKFVINSIIRQEVEGQQIFTPALNIQNNGKISLIMGAETIPALIDTGAHISLISEQIRDRLPPDLVIATKRVKALNATVANGAKMPINNIVILALEAEKGTHLLELHVAPNLIPGVILGMDFLKPLGSIIDLGRNTITFRPPAEVAKPRMIRDDQGDLVLKLNTKIETMENTPMIQNHVQPMESQYHNQGVMIAAVIEEIRDEMEEMEGPDMDKEEQGQYDDEELKLMEERENEQSLPIKEKAEEGRDEGKREEISKETESEENAEERRPHQQHDRTYYKKNEIPGVFLESHQPGMNKPARLGIDLRNSPITEAQKTELRKIIIPFHSAFAESTAQLGVTNVLECKIEMMPGTIPTSSRIYRTSMHEKEVISTQINEMLEKGIIYHSTAAYSSPIVLVTKSDGTMRMCISRGG
jgi:predicted aspartyl protease